MPLRPIILWFYFVLTQLFDPLWLFVFCIFWLTIFLFKKIIEISMVRWKSKESSSIDPNLHIFVDLVNGNFDLWIILSCSIAIRTDIFWWFSTPSELLKKNFTFILASENIRHFVEVGELHSNSRFTSLYVLLGFFTQKWSQKEEYKRKRKKIKKLYSISIPVTSTEIFHRFFTQQSFCCPVCYYIQAFFQILWKSRCNI